MIDYDPHLWRDHLFDFRGSVLRKVIPRMTVFGVWGAAVCWCNEHYFAIAMPSTAHALVGVALGLLLVFRTNASYDRFWEGRRQWGAIVNATRNLARASISLMREATGLSEQVRLWTAAFSHALMHRLRERVSLGTMTEKLPAVDVDRCIRSGNAPLAASIQISRAIAVARQAGVITEHEQMLMDTQVAYLIDAAGACDRIHRTPLPFAYVVHLRRALAIYCLTLPLALIDGFAWSTPLVTVFVSYILLGIEEIGVEIEDPFGVDDNDLPLEKFCQTIEADLLSVDTWYPVNLDGKE